MGLLRLSYKNCGICLGHTLALPSSLILPSFNLGEANCQGQAGLDKLPQWGLQSLANST